MTTTQLLMEFKAIVQIQRILNSVAAQKPLIN